MCGIAALLGSGWRPEDLAGMVAVQAHRGPDASGCRALGDGLVGLGHRRLKVVDLSDAGAQPMVDASGRRWISFNGEIYNHRELRQQLADYPFRGRSDTEVLLAAWDRWGVGCLERLVGMFAFVLWDGVLGQLVAVRDRFGVKPLYRARTPAGAVAYASEIKALWAAGTPRTPDLATWATYLERGLYDHGPETFWEGVTAVRPGHVETWERGHLTTRCWYDLPARVGPGTDPRPEASVRTEYEALLAESVDLRLRADVPVGVSVSGGLDSALLLTLIAGQRAGEGLTGYTWVTGDPHYDEWPWAQQAAAHLGHQAVRCLLSAPEVPAMAERVAASQDEPFGGLPTLTYARLFEQARADGLVVLLDGQGMDEQWAGYDYYRRAADDPAVPVVQGARSPAAVPGAILPGLQALTRPFEPPAPFPDALRNAQYRDLAHTKLPRAMRFNDRVSMQSSIELREPFLDHRLVELALRQPPDRKLGDDHGKRLLRTIARALIPRAVSDAPKRPVQSPQREWLRGPLAEWADAMIEDGLDSPVGRGLDAAAVRRHWAAYRQGAGDNSYAIWQWIGLGLQAGGRTGRVDAARVRQQVPCA